MTTTTVTTVPTIDDDDDDGMNGHIMYNNGTRVEQPEDSSGSEHLEHQDIRKEDGDAVAEKTMVSMMNGDGGEGEQPTPSGEFTPNYDVGEEEDTSNSLEVVMSEDLDGSIRSDVQTSVVEEVCGHNEKQQQQTDQAVDEAFVAAAAADVQTSVVEQLCGHNEKSSSSSRPIKQWMRLLWRQRPL